MKLKMRFRNIFLMAGVFAALSAIYGCKQSVKEEPVKTVFKDLGEPANCYIVSEKGFYSFKPIKVSGAVIEGISTADWLWSTKTENDIPLVSQVKFNGELITFSASGGRGNVVIAAFNQTGDIVWSWHIWCAEPPGTMVYENGLKFMDRNIGALEAGYSEAAYGLLYQWGRKDPIYGGTKTSEPVTKPFEFAFPATITNPKYPHKWDFKKGFFYKEDAIKAPMTFYRHGKDTDFNGD